MLISVRVKNGHLHNWVPFHQAAYLGWRAMAFSVAGGLWRSRLLEAIPLIGESETNFPTAGLSPTLGKRWRLRSFAQSD